MNTEEFTELAKTDLISWLKIYIQPETNILFNPYYYSFQESKYGLKLVEVLSIGGYEDEGNYVRRVFAIVPDFIKKEKTSKSSY